ncbi:Ubiquitin-specific protease, partial [Globisporangium splendens]
MDEDENSNGVSVDDVERIADELVHDFEGACLLIANELTSSSDPALLLEILISVGQSQEREEQENGEETHRRWLPEDVFDRFEADFLPQAVQLVLGKPFDRECVECVNRFLQFVLGRVKIRLSQGDPCLLPTLIRILDDQRQFYVYHGSFDKDERDDNKDEGMNDGAAAESETVQFVMELVLVKVLQIQQQTTQRNQGNEDMPEVEGEEDAEETDLSESGSDQFGRSVQLLRLDIYLRHFRSSSLEKRIYGLTEIVAAITRQFNGQVREQHDPTPSTLLRKLDYLVFWMHDNRLIEDLFGEKLHAELIKRTVSLFQFMSELECLLPESLDIVLSCYRGSSSISQNVNQVPTQQCHEAQRTTVQAILEALVDFVDDRLLRHLFCHLQSARVVDANRLALLAAIAARNELSDRYTGGGESRLRDQVVIHMWDVVRSGIVSEELAGQTLQRLEDILRKDISEWNEEVDEDLPSGSSKAYQLVHVLLQSCIDNVCKRTQTSVSLKFLAQLALMVSDLKVQLPNLNCPEKKSLVDVLIDELAEYKNKAWNNIQKDHPEVSAGNLLDYSPTQQDTAELVSDPASHANEVKVRLLALRAAWIIEDQQAPSSRSCPSVSLLQLDLVWHLLIKTACTTDEASLCFQWIEFYLNTSRALSEEDDPDRRSSLLSMESVKHLLFNNFSTLSGSRVTLLTLCCFQSLFRHVNLLAGGLQSFAASRENDSSGCLPADGGEIVDLATNQPLIGLEQLWHLAIRSVNSTVAEECIALLTSFYLEIVPSLRCTGIFLQKKPEFVETCMGFLTSAKSKAEKLQRQRPNDQGTIAEEADENVAIVNRCVDLFRYFLDACDGTTEDESGSGAFDDPHSAHLHSSGELTSKRKVFQLENLEERLQYLDIYPSPMKEMPSSNAVAGSGLSETGLLSVSRRPSWTFRQQHALLDAISDEGECDDSDQNDERNHDLLLSEIPAHIESSELAEFSSPPIGSSLLLMQSGTPGKSSMKSPTTRVRPTLHLPQDVSPQRGPDLTLEDVSKALEEVSTDGEQVQETGKQSVIVTASGSASLKSKYSLMSQILANEGAYFDTLLQLVDWSDATSQRTWELICRLPTNNELLRKMIRLRPSALGANEDVVWENLLSTTNIHRLLYALRLVEALLLPPESSLKIPIDRNSDTARRQWRERFVRLGGVKHLYETFLLWERVHLAALRMGTDGAVITSSLSAYTKNLAATCLAAVIRTLNYFVQLHQTQLPHGKFGKEESSPFDLRLKKSTLPSLIKSINLASLIQRSVHLTFVYASSGVCEVREGESTKAKVLSVISTQSEEAIQCGLQLFTVISTLEPQLLEKAFCDQEEKTLSDVNQNTTPSLISLNSWIKSVLYDCPSPAARTSALEHLTDLTTAGPLCQNKSLFVEKLVKVLSDLVINTDGSSDPEQLFSFLNNLLCSGASRWQLSTKQSVLQWLSANNTSNLIVSRLYEIVALDAAHTPENGIEGIVCGFLQLLQSLVLLSDGQREAILTCCPENAEQLGSSGEWMADFLLRKLLFGDSTSVSSSDEAPSLTSPKYKSQGSRDLAQKLLFSLVTSRQKAMQYPGSCSRSAISRILKCHDSYQKSVLASLIGRGRPWNFSPKELLQDTENEIDCAGLVNPGCICYMNALVQQLFMTPSFREGLLSVDCMSEATGSSPWADEVTELQRLFVSLALTHFKSFDPTQFALSHQDLDGNPTNLRVQMDADEFFCLLLDRIDTSLRAATPPESDALSERDVQSVNFLDKCFGGVLVNQIITQQGYVSEREERFFALSLEVSKKQHLKECLSLYVQGESLDGENAYFCERLQQKVSETKRICIKKLPQTLVFHLKRFEFDFDTMEKLKINDYLEFPQEIDMLPYTSEGLASSFPDSPRQRECNEPIDDALKGQPSTMYDLVGIVVHSGTSDMGHYYSFIKDRRRPERWLEFNDEVVREFDIERMDEECFGGEEAKPHWDGTSRVSKVQMERRNAYMLLYERRDDVSVSSENKGNAEKILQSEGVWQNPSTASDSLQALSRQLSQQNIQFQEIVDAFDPHYGDFIEALANLGLEYTSSEVEGEPGRAVGDFHDWDGNIAMLPHRMTNLGISVLGSQYLFGIAPLLPTTCDQSSFQLQGRLVERILTWLSAENPETNADASEQFLFSSWLLRQVVASPPSGKPSESAGLQEIRTWFFDIMFLSENNPELVDGCVSILSMSVSILTRQIVSVLDHLELNDLDENEPAYVVLTSFYRAALILFNDREQEIELTDSTTGGVFILPSSTIITAQTRIGTFLENCICHAFEDHSKEREVTRQMFAAKVQYLDRFLFALQGELPSRKSSGSTHSTFSASSLNASPSRLLEALGVDRIRSCTFTQERSILKELLQRTQSSDKCSSQSSQAKELESLFDISLLMSQVALTNILRYSFEDMLAPAIVAAIHRGSHSQRDKLLSLLIAVLEDVKATQLEKLLRVFDSLLDSEESEVHSASDFSAFVDRAPIHKHLFSPTRGILEAAAYYKDHRTLHEYSFLLLEFTVNRTKDSPLLQHLFKHDVEIGEQAGWITNWLVSYLDPSGSTRRNEPADNTDDEIQLAQDVRTLFEAIEQSFGCVLFPTSKKSDAAASHSSSASLAEKVRESKRSANTANQDDEVDATIVSLQDIATEFEDAYNPKQPGQAAPIKPPYGLILQEATSEIEIDDSDEPCRMHLNGKDDDDGVAVNFSLTKNAPSLSSFYGHHELYNNRSEA